jgi:hypothetical protein
MKILLYNPDNGVTRNFMPHLWMFLLTNQEADVLGLPGLWIRNTRLLEFGLPDDCPTARSNIAEGVRTRLERG